MPATCQLWLAVLLGADAWASDPAASDPASAPQSPTTTCVVQGVVQAEAVHALVTISAEDPLGAPLHVVAADADGGFEVTLTAPGTYRVSASAQGLVPDRHTLSCAPGHSEIPVELSLSPGAAPVDVRVRGEDNKPVEGAVAILSTVTKTDVDPEPIVLGVPGEGLSFQLERGRTYRVSVAARGYGTDSTEFYSDEAQNLRFQFYLPKLRESARSRAW
jgi:hypothetical protein